MTDAKPGRSASNTGMGAEIGTKLFALIIVLNYYVFNTELRKYWGKDKVKLNKLICESGFTNA